MTKKTIPYFGSLAVALLLSIGFGAFSAQADVQKGKIVTVGGDNWICDCTGGTGPCRCVV